MIKPRIGCYAVYEPTEEGWQSLDEQFRQINADLREAGLTVVEAPEPICDDASCERLAAWFAAQEIDLLHTLVITWSFDHYTVRIQQTTGLPVAIRSIPGIRTGSIVGGQQLGSLLADIDVEHRLFYGNLGDSATAQQVAVYAQACFLKKSLKGARFAMLGRRTPGMTPIAVDEVEIMRLFGTRLVNLGMDEFSRLVDKVDLGEAEEEWKSVSGRAAAVSCNPEHAVASMRHYLALKRLINDLNLQGVTIGSYPDCQGVACLPIALLNNEGIVAGCEGDMNSTLVMYLLYQLSGEPVHFGEMLAIDEQENSLITSHCGSAAPNLADEDGYILCPVRLAHSGVCIRFTARTGPITYVNLVGRKGNYRLCAFEGEALTTSMVFEGNPLRFKMKTPFPKIWQAVSEDGFGHHWMSAYAHVVPQLAEFCRLTGIKGVFPDLLPD